LGEFGIKPTPKAQSVRNRSGKWTIREIDLAKMGSQLVLESGWHYLLGPPKRKEGALYECAFKLSGFGQKGGMWVSRAALFLLRILR
jgi:hypothetical protein